MNVGDDEAIDDVSPGEERNQLLHDLKTTGARSAYDALVSVCQDSKAPAPAKATAGVALLRAAGFFAAPEENHQKPLHEMTGSELQAEIARLERKRRRRRQASGTENDGGVFD